MCWPVVIVFARSMSLMTLIRREVDEIELNLPTLRVVHVLGRGAANRCYRVMLHIDNSPDFISLTLAEWVDIHVVKLDLIQAGQAAPRTLTLSVLTGHIVQKYSILSVQNAE